MLRRCVDAMAARPKIFDALRWILEAGYRGHHRTIERELLTTSGPVLDLGCGTGVFAPCFAVDDYLGVDLSPTYIEAAARKHPAHRFAVMDARQLPLPDHSFDRAFISGMLHHLSDEDCATVLSEIERVAHPSGRVVIWEDVPTRSAWNLPGRLIHRLDLGDRIRDPAGYRQMIAQRFDIESEWPLRSGCMDYVVFRCRARP